VSTPFLLGLVFVGALALWYFRASAARESRRAAAESKARNRAARSAQSVNAALKGRR
jgi:hypothetical protein